MFETGTTLTITQNGWIVECRYPDAMAQISNRDLYTVSSLTEGSYLIDFKNKACGYDYIDLALQVISDLEAAFAKNPASAPAETIGTNPVKPKQTGIRQRPSCDSNISDRRKDINRMRIYLRGHSSGEA